MTRALRIWLVMGDKGGDNAQVEMVAEALNLPFEVKHIQPLEKYVYGKPFFRPTIRHLDLQRSDPLEKPWPDLILCMGRRTTMAALWIQKQSRFTTRIVLVGRPRRYEKRFSLIVSSTQFQANKDPGKAVSLDFPLLRTDYEAIEASGKQWQSRFDGLPKPITAVFIGGKTAPYEFGADTAVELLDKSLAVTQGEGTLYLSTSRRTAQAAVQAIEQRLPANAILYRWGQDGAENPYQALLALADRFIVTGDSISMMIEVAQLVKPMAIFELPYQKNLATTFKRLLQGENPVSKLLNLIVLGLQGMGIVGYARDLRKIHQRLYEKGLAVPLGQAFRTHADSKIDTQFDEISERVKKLIDEIEQNNQGGKN